MIANFQYNFGIWNFIYFEERKENIYLPRFSKINLKYLYECDKLRFYDFIPELDDTNVSTSSSFIPVSKNIYGKNFKLNCF